MVASVTAVSAGHAGVGYLTGGGGCETDHEWDMAADGKHPDSGNRPAPGDVGQDRPQSTSVHTAVALPHGPQG